MKKIDFKHLNTKRLLSYYKIERDRFFNYGFKCGCGCNEFRWDISDKYEYLKPIYDEWFNYLNEIKLELNTREHISN